MANQVGLFYGDKLTEDYAYKVKLFANLISEKEREEFAKLCDCVYDNIVTEELTDEQIKNIQDMKFIIRGRDKNDGYV